MTHRCLVASNFINHSLKLTALPSTTCIRHYAMTYDQEEREKKIKTRITKVNVITPNQKVSSMTLDQAQRMAKRRNYLMTLLTDPPKFASYSGRDVYEMITKSTHVKQSAESSENSEETTEGFKERKTITFSETIAEHDLKVKIKQIQKLLSKNHSVVVVISNDGEGVSKNEKETLVHTACKDLSKITIVNKKKQTVITLTPNQPNGE